MQLSRALQGCSTDLITAYQCNYADALAKIVYMQQTQTNVTWGG